MNLTHYLCLVLIRLAHTCTDTLSGNDLQPLNYKYHQHLCINKPLDHSLLSFFCIYGRLYIQCLLAYPFLFLVPMSNQKTSLENKYSSSLYYLIGLDIFFHRQRTTTQRSLDLPAFLRSYRHQPLSNPMRVQMNPIRTTEPTATTIVTATILMTFSLNIFLSYISCCRLFLI